MNETKRLRARAIILHGDKLLSMYRERDGRVFYTFPGGGAEGNETGEECVVREVYEELGINVKPIKLAYVYENQLSIEHFYLCEWTSGEFGTGNGEEYQPDRNKGLYRPTMINIADIPNLPLMPPEVATAFCQDYKQNGRPLCNEVKNV